MSELFEYGITTSNADVWIHVCPNDLALYWYRRLIMVREAAGGRYQEREIVSARGYLVPVGEWFIQRIEVPQAMMLRYGWQEAPSDAKIGRYAEHLVRDCFSVGIMPGFHDLHFLSNKREQQRGVDFEVRPRGYEVEVKADIRGGRAGTGNLFVQTHELHHHHGKRNAHLQPTLRVVR